MLSLETLSLIRQFLRDYPRRSAVMVVLLLIAGLAEGIGLMTLLPVLEIAMTDTAELSMLSQFVVEVLASVGLPPALPILLFIVVLAIGLKALFQFLAMRHVGHTVAHVATDLRLAYISAVLGAQWSFFVGERTGRVSTAVSGEAHRAATAYRHACALLAAMIQAAVYLSIALLISWPVAILGVLAGGALALVLGRLVQMSRAAGRKQTELTRALISRITDSLQGIKAIKAMGREAHLQPLLEAETRGINAAYRRQVVASEGLKHTQEPLLVLMLAVALYFAIGVMDQPLPAVMILAFLFYRLVGRMGLVQGEYQTLAASESAYYSITDGIRAARQSREDAGGVLPAAFTDCIEFDNVSFAYGDKHVLRDVTFGLPAGRFITMIGPSGAGKTTIADLVVGLRAPTAGTIRVDGRPLSEVRRKEWRRLIGYVPQELFLFHDTLLKNITLGDPNIPEETVCEALRLAGALDFVEALPDGLQTVVGERGSRLSGGQRQRIAIARAVCGEPRLLILDEVTASLDPITEAALCETLKGLRGRMTILAISHQPALAAPADIVYRVDAGHLTRVNHREFASA
jgi:ATP-binding cassette, subfamily C, bacterial